jgi:GAF domain-containing protein
MTNALAQDPPELVADADQEPKQEGQGTTSEAQANVLAILSVMHGVGRSRTPEDVARTALEGVKTTFGWAYGSYWILDETSNTLRFALESGALNEDFQRVTTEARFREVGGLLRRAWRGRELVFVEDVSDITDCARARSAKEAGVKSGVCFPVIVHGEVAGIMDFLTLDTLSPSPERLEVLRYVGRIVSSAVEHLMPNQKPSPAGSA